MIGSSASRVDPYGVLPMLAPMTSAQIGEFAYPFLWHARRGTADVRMLHVLDLCGWALTQREAVDEADI